MRAENEQRTQYIAMIGQWQRSGLSQKQFCAGNNIRYHVFHYWYRVYKTEQNATSSFLPINVKAAIRQEQITITGLNGLQVQLPFCDQAAGFIKQLLLS
jgi:hypothetical protein